MHKGKHIYYEIFGLFIIRHHKETYYKVLAHVITEAEKSRYLPSASWRLRKAGDILYLPGNTGKVDRSSRQSAGFLCSSRPISHSRFPHRPWGGRWGSLTTTGRQFGTSEAGSDGQTHARCVVHLSHLTMTTSLQTMCYGHCIFAEEAGRLGTVCKDLLQFGDPGLLPASFLSALPPPVHL